MTQLRSLVLLGLLAAAPAWAGNHSIEGQVVDRNGEPVEKAIISLAPGNVQMVTDREGRFLIDYLRDEEGKRVRLGKRADYALEVYKPGFHPEKRNFYYKRGAIAVEGLVLTEESVSVEDMGEDLDPALYSTTTHGAGANYEGQ